MLRKRVKGENRSEDKIREHYEIEVELADKLRKSSKDERRSLNLYTSLYDELYRRVPLHPQLTRKKSAWAIMCQYGLLKRFINEHTNFFIEVGPGDCALSFKVATIVEKVFAIDVSNIITENLSVPPNFELILTDGCSIPLPKDSIDVAYSNNLMEHLHPDDTREQLQNIFDVLKPGGCYICLTPNKVAGPWDISCYYDEVAKGFHLKEYTISELANMFKEVGFKYLRAYAGARGKYARFPISPIIWLERILFLLPFGVRSKIGRSLIFRRILGINLVGIK